MATPQTPALTRERFLATPTFDEYVERMTVNREKMLQHLEEVQVPPEDIAWWRSQGKLNVYVLTYDSCGDALYNLPVFAKIAKQCPNIDLRVAQRDENLDIMDQHLNQGIYRSVPCFIFLDENFQEIANLKERSEAMTRVIEQEQLALRRRLREQYKEAWRAEMLREFKEVVATRKKYP
ncbi:MAG TPA: thioredoxin family protein [Chloroflexota bacterium]|nr:thioredoxin family protein [Chloroflexota bacterium]